jgi:DNA-binding ferritin-like protein (Dps family)
MLQPFYSTNQSTTPSINESLKQSFRALNKFKWKSHLFAKKNEKVINNQIIDLFWCYKFDIYKVCVYRT